MYRNVIYTFILILSGLCGVNSAVQAATTINKVISFGDSLSDNGNLFHDSKLLHQGNPEIDIVPNQPYYEGRFCNGPVWVEYLTESLHLDPKIHLKDYAYGGAWVEPFEFSNQIYPPNLQQQIDIFLQDAVNDDDFEHHLFTIWHGANDLLKRRDSYEFATSNIIDIIRTQMMRLIDRGAKNFVMVNMPDLGIVPMNIELRPALDEQQTEASNLYNQKLTILVNELRELYDVNIVVVDVYKALHTIAETKTFRGRTFTHYRMPCYKGRAAMRHVDDDDLQGGALAEHVCRKPDEYVFWDWIHPSTIINKIISEDIMDKLSDVGIRTK